MSMTNTKNNGVEVLGPGRRRRWTRQLEARDGARATSNASIAILLIKLIDYSATS